MQPENSKRKLLLFIFIIILVAAVFILGYFFYVSRSAAQITGLEVALKIATFLDSTLQSNGEMLAGFGCVPGNKDCTPLPVLDDQPHLGQAIFAYHALTKATGDQSYQEKSARVMDWVLEKCQTNVQACAWNYFPLSQFYFETKDDKYLQAMLRVAQQFLDALNEDVITQNAGHKLAALYKATNDERYRKRLIEIADEKLADWPSQTDYSIQIVWNVFIPVYEITKDKKYLSASEQFFNDFNLADNFEKIRPSQTIFKGVEALLGLANISDNGVAYRAQAHDVLQKAINNLWDTPENTIINGDYGFINITPTDQISKIKFTVDNGWILKSFLILKDEKFDLSRQNND